MKFHGMKITFYGQSCFLIETGSNTFLVDPFISGNPLATHIDIERIECDFILLTHGHMDHVADVNRIADRTEAVIVANYEIATWYEKKGYQTVGANLGGWWNYDGGRIKFVNAIHSSVLPDGTYGGNPVGFVIEGADATLYISGDTALTMDMNLIPLTCKPLDAAILCIGDHYTMGVEDAAMAASFVACKKVIGAHYDTFEPIKIDHEMAKWAFSEKSINLHLIPIGESMDI